MRAVPVRHLMQVLLVLIFGQVVGNAICFHTGHFSRDLPIARGRQGVLILRDPPADQLGFFFGICVERGAILRAYVVALAVALGWVVRLKGRAHQIFQLNFGRVIDHLHQLHVVGLPAAHFPVAGVGRDPTSVAHGG